MALSANELLLLELVNRARLDPQAEAARYGTALNEGVDPKDTISAAPKQPLAANPRLATAAERHSAHMLEVDEFEHKGIGDGTPGERIGAAGYTWRRWGENQAWLGNTDEQPDPTLAVLAHHAGLYRSAVHRENLMDGAFREVGLARLSGEFTDGGTYKASMLTEDFATAADGRRFVTGAVFEDTDEDRFYDPGEGTAGAVFRVGGESGTSAAAGGYALAAAPGTATVAIEAAGLDAEVGIDTSHGNAKLDLIDGTRLATSADLTLRSGITEAQALGAGNVTLTGSDAADRLTGNDAANHLAGGDGDDFIFGGTGRADLRDEIYGGAGDDNIEGGFGNDLLVGGDGDDRLNGGFGVERIEGRDGDDVVNGAAFSDLVFGNAGDDFVNGGFGNDRINGGPGADRFFHIGDPGHGTDFVQDFAAEEGDTLLFGRDAEQSDFGLKTPEIPGAGTAGVEEALVTYKPGGQILWVLIDGADQDAIELTVNGEETFDLMA